MQTIARTTLAIAVFAVGLAPALPVAADTLEKQCAALQSTRQTGCTLERPRGREWTLTTRVEVGSGRKASVQAVEDSFCAAAGRAGAPASVTRWNSLPGTLGEGAKLEWRCDPPAVSAAPKPRAHR